MRVSESWAAAITAVDFCKDMRAPLAKLSLFILNIYNYMCACTVVQLERCSSLMSLFLKFFQVVMFIFSQIFSFTMYMIGKLY